MKIQGLDELSIDQLNFELQRGGKFVVYNYCISLLIVTLKRASVHFVRADESRVSKGVPWTLLSLVLGWWGIPWGPIYTIQSVVVNFQGGKDVTREIVASLQKPAQAAAPVAGAPPKT